MRSPPRTPNQLVVRVVRAGAIALSDSTTIGVTAVHVEADQWVDAEQLAGRDLAILQLAEREAIAPAPVRTGDCLVHVGTVLTAVGFGLNEVREGLVRRETNVRVRGVQDTLISTDPSACLGDSGGPLLNEQGELIAVASRSGCGVGEAQYSHVCGAVGLLQRTLCQDNPDAQVCGTGPTFTDAGALLDSVLGLDASRVVGAEGATAVGCSVVPASHARFSRDAVGWLLLFWLLIAQRRVLPRNYSLPNLNRESCA